MGDVGKQDVRVDQWSAMGASDNELLRLLAFDLDRSCLHLNFPPLSVDKVRLAVLAQLFFKKITVVVEGCRHGPGQVITFANHNARAAWVRASNQVDFFALVHEGQLHELPEGRDLRAQVRVSAEDGFASRRKVAMDDPVVAGCRIVQNVQILVWFLKIIGIRLWLLLFEVCQC